MRRSAVMLSHVRPAFALRNTLEAPAAYTVSAWPGDWSTAIANAAPGVKSCGAEPAPLLLLRTHQADARITPGADLPWPPAQ